MSVTKNINIYVKTKEEEKEIKRICKNTYSLYQFFSNIKIRKDLDYSYYFWYEYGSGYESKIEVNKEGLKFIKKLNKKLNKNFIEINDPTTTNDFNKDC